MVAASKPIPDAAPVISTTRPVCAGNWASVKVGGGGNKAESKEGILGRRGIFVMVLDNWMGML